MVSPQLERWEWEELTASLRGKGLGEGLGGEGGARGRSLLVGRGSGASFAAFFTVCAFRAAVGLLTNFHAVTLLMFLYQAQPILFHSDKRESTGN